MSAIAYSAVDYDKQGTGFTLLFGAHVIVLLFCGLLNLVAPIFSAEVSGAFFVWTFVLSILYVHAMVAVFVNRSGLYLGKHIRMLITFLFVLFMWRLMQVFWSVDSAETVKEAVKTVILLLFVVAVLLSLAQFSRANLMRIPLFTVTILLSLSLIALLYLFLSHGAISSFGNKSFKPFIHIFGGSNIAAAIVLMLGLWNWLLVTHDSKSYRRVGLYNGAATIILLIGIASYSALAGYLASIVVLLARFLARRKHGILTIIVITLTGSVFIVILSIRGDISSLGSINLNAATTHRDVLWNDALYKLEHGAWLYGIGSAAYSETDVFNKAMRGGVHNALLQSWVEGGIVELVLHLGLYVWLIRLSLKSCKRESWILISMLAGIFARNLGESSGFPFGLVNNFMIFFSWYIAAYFVILMQKEECGEISRRNMTSLACQGCMRGGTNDGC